MFACKKKNPFSFEDKISDCIIKNGKKMHKCVCVRVCVYVCFKIEAIK